MRSKTNYAVVFMASLVVFTSLCIDKANAENKTAPTIVQPKQTGPYCGLNCVYTIMKLAGEPVEYKDLLKPKYLGSRKGSSVTELAKAAEENGLKTKLLQNATVRTLKECPYPCILHVKKTVSSKSYNHFELYLGHENGKIRLYDAPKMKLVNPSELAPRWNGNGLIVGIEEIKTGRITFGFIKTSIAYGFGTICIVLVIHLCKQLYSKWKQTELQKRLVKSIIQCACLGCLALLSSIIINFFDECGLLSNASAVESIQKANQGKFIPKVSQRVVQKAQKKDVVFVDARYTHDYKRGHLSKAINLPVNATDEQRQETMKTVPTKTTIIVYCQSRLCKYAEIVAEKLKLDGYRDVSIYQGGWKEWTSAGKDGKAI